MPASQSMVRIPQRRHEQLKALASARGMTITEVIAEGIRAQIKEGFITDGIPGVLIERFDRCIRLVIDDNPAKTFSIDGARMFAASIREVIETGSTVVNFDHGFGVVRRGSGYQLSAPFKASGGEAFSADIATDIARLLDEAAA